jgi:hypothetical protein
MQDGAEFGLRNEIADSEKTRMIQERQGFAEKELVLRRVLHERKSLFRLGGKALFAYEVLTRLQNSASLSGMKPSGRCDIHELDAI